MSPENNGCGERAKGNNVFAMITMIKMMNMMSHESHWLISLRNGGESGWIHTAPRRRRMVLLLPSSPQPTWLESETKSAFIEIWAPCPVPFSGGGAKCYESSSSLPSIHVYKVGHRVGGEHDELVLSDLFSFLHCLPPLGEKSTAITRIKGGGIFLGKTSPGVCVWRQYQYVCNVSTVMRCMVRR